MRRHDDDDDAAAADNDYDGQQRLSARVGDSRRHAEVAGRDSLFELLTAIISGRFAPVGRLPFALASNLQAVIDNAPDAPGYPAADTLFPFGFGLRY